jgi:hypothetical protein
MPVTEEMILECYDAFRRNDRKYIPQGMNANSASMSMLWFDSLLTGKPYHRDGSALQYELILNRIKEDYGIEQLLEAKAVLMEHCEWSLQHHKKPMKKHRAVLNSFDIMPTDDSAELEKIVEALLDIPNLAEPKGVDKPKVKTQNNISSIERDPKVKAWVIQQANGKCEYCQETGFIKDNGRHYMEAHHLRPLAEHGSDTTRNTVAVCPNCHKKLHFAECREKIRTELIQQIPRLKDEYL